MVIEPEWAPTSDDVMIFDVGGLGRAFGGAALARFWGGGGVAWACHPQV